jgi:hypothetical protein
MKRRQFIFALGGAAAAWPLAARAQQVGKLPTIGFLGSSTLSAMSKWIAAFVQRLRERGWIEGRTSRRCEKRALTFVRFRSKRRFSSPDGEDRCQLDARG